jgi:hypothetical protein
MLVISKDVEAVLWGCERLQYLYALECMFHVAKINIDWLQLSHMQLHACVRFRAACKRSADKPQQAPGITRQTEGRPRSEE